MNKFESIINAANALKESRNTKKKVEGRILKEGIEYYNSQNDEFSMTATEWHLWATYLLHLGSDEFNNKIQLPNNVIKYLDRCIAYCKGETNKIPEGFEDFMNKYSKEFGSFKKSVFVTIGTELRNFIANSEDGIITRSPRRKSRKSIRKSESKKLKEDYDDYDDYDDDEIEEITNIINTNLKYAFSTLAENLATTFVESYFEDPQGAYDELRSNLEQFLDPSTVNYILERLENTLP